MVIIIIILRKILNRNVFSKIAVVFLYFSFPLFLDGAFCFLIIIIIIIIIITASGCGVSTWLNEVTLCCKYLQVTLEQGVVPVSSPRGLEIPGWRPAGASLSHG